MLHSHIFSFLAFLILTIVKSDEDKFVEKLDQRKENPSRTALVTVVDGDEYAMGAVVLSKSFRATYSIPSNIDMMAISPHGGSISKEAEKYLLSEGGFNRVLKLQETSVTSKATNGQEGREEIKGMGLAKTVFYALSEYDRMLFVDADTFAVRTMSIFENPSYWKGNVTGIPEVNTIIPMFKTEFLAIRPNEIAYRNLMKTLEIYSYRNVDRKLFNRAFRNEWDKKSPQEKIPHDWQLSVSYCVLAERKPEYQSMYDNLLENARMFDFRGKVKPWKWPERIRYKKCKSLVPWLYAWLGIAYAPDLDAVREFLSIFNADRKNMNLNRMSEVIDAAREAYLCGSVDENYYKQLSNSTSGVLDFNAFDHLAYDSESSINVSSKAKKGQLNAYVHSLESSGYSVFFKFG